MPNTLTVAQLQNAQTMITQGNVTGFYSYMYSQGYGYASLANSVVNCSGASGATAQGYMVQSAAAQGVNLTTAKITTIEASLASGYVGTLLNAANSLINKGVTNQDVSYEEALGFHSTVFTDNGLLPDTWTMYTPGQVLEKSVVDADWNQIISSNALTSLVGIQ